MNKLVFFAFIAIVFASCEGSEQEKKTWEKATTEEKWEMLQDGFMVPGVGTSDERPLPNVLSEREALVKAADVAIAEGVLDPSYYAYQRNPDIMTAKIETPILLTDAETGVPDSYLLNAVGDNGISLALVSINADRDADEQSFVRGRFVSLPETAHNHIMTKHEATELIQNQFSGEEVSTPMMIGNLHLGDDPHSHRALFWYFTVGETSRNVAGISEEYIIAADISGWSSIPNGMTSRSAIDFPHGDPHLNGYRMAKLDNPLGLFEKLAAARSAGGASFSTSIYPRETFGFTPVPLK